MRDRLPPQRSAAKFARRRRPEFTAEQVCRAEEALARVGITRALRATGVDRNDFLELHVDQLVELLGVKRTSRRRA